MVLMMELMMVLMIVVVVAVSDGGGVGCVDVDPDVLSEVVTTKEK